MRKRSVMKILDDIGLYAELQRRGGLMEPDELVTAVSELRVHEQYAFDYHSITQHGIALAKIALMQNDPELALRYLQDLSNSLDEATLKHYPDSFAAKTIRDDANHATQDSSTTAPA